MNKMIRSFLVALAVWSAVALPTKVEAQATWSPVACTMVPCPGVDANFVDNWYWVQGTGYVSYSTLFSHARASAETCTNAVGFITYATSGNPCVTSAGLQIWEARTNLFLQSQSPANAYWTVDAATLGGSTIAPDGTSTAVAFIPNSGSVAPDIKNSSTTQVDSTVYTYWRIVKYNGITPWVEMTTVDNNVKRSWFNIQTGVTGTLNHTSSFVTPLSNGFYAIGVTYTSSGTSNQTFISPRAGNGSTGAITGDGATPSYFLWGAQFELGAFPSPYIPTTSGTAGRAADVITATGALDTLLRGSAATVLVKAGPTPNFAAFPRLVGSSPSAQGLPFVGNGATNVGIYNGTTALNNAESGNISTGVQRLGASWAPGARSVTGAGASVFTDTNSQLSNTSYIIGSLGSANSIDGNEQRLFVYGSQLPNATLQSLSGGSW